MFCDNCDLLDCSVVDELRQQVAMYGQRYDIETGLLNNQSFQDALAEFLRDGPAGQEIALIWIDLVNLRREFSLYGLKGAEALARRVAGNLRSVKDSDAILGRIGARSFLVAMYASKLDKDGRNRIQAVADALTPLWLQELNTKPEVVAGVAFYPSDTESVEDLVRFASLAAARASREKSRAVIAYHAGMNSQVMHDHLLYTQMMKGLDQDQFSVSYQPCVDLKWGHILSAEALIRWKHPEWGQLKPDDFIPIAEHSGLIDRIFYYTLRTALKDTQQWKRLGLFIPIISVNVSATNMRKSDFIDSVRGILEEIPIKPSQLELEMTESVLFDDEEMLALRIRQLKEIDVRISIDDFGTRYTGFNLLKELPIDTMKIDKCFIRGIDRSKDMQVLCKTIVAMARQLKLHIVAEGIEEFGELEVMQQIGCDAGQGYLFLKPAPADEFVVFLRNWSGWNSRFGFASAQGRVLSICST